MQGFLSEISGVSVVNHLCFLLHNQEEFTQAEQVGNMIHCCVNPLISSNKISCFGEVITEITIL